ncbi:hypothetical protein HK102_013458, partial [Quaeritorhiza haematococci]
MGLALITGLQNDGNLTSPTSVIAEPKHFAAHSIPEGGRNLGPAQLGPREFFRSFAPVFETALLHGDAQSVMSAYSEIDGVPCSANKALLRTLLRDMWRFKGFVLSDLGAINMLWSWHRVAQTPKEAIRQFLTAGGNMQFYDFSHETWETAVRELVESGEVPMQMLDSRVKDVLRVKMRLGLFENPFTEGELVERHVNTKKHKELALQAARQSIVMLFNKDGALPFDLKSERRAGTGGHMQENNDNDGDMETIAIIGPTVDAPHFGDYSNGAPDPDNIVTLLEGVKRIISQTTTPSTNKPRVVYAPGTGILNNAETYPIRGHWFKSIPPNPTSARKSPTTDNDYSQYTSPGILGTYYTTPNFTSPPLLTRTDSAGINFDYFIWGSPLASPRLPSNEFSAVWEGILDMREEVERVMKLPGEKVNGLIEVDSDGDPFRLVVDGVVVLERVQGEETGVSGEKEGDGKEGGWGMKGIPEHERPMALHAIYRGKSALRGRRRGQHSRRSSVKTSHGNPKTTDAAGENIQNANGNTASQTVVPFTFENNRVYKIRLELQHPRGSKASHIALKWTLVDQHPPKNADETSNSPCAYSTGIQQALERAQSCSSIVLALGDNTITSGEGFDRATLDLPSPNQRHLLSCIATHVAEFNNHLLTSTSTSSTPKVAKPKRLIVVLQTGRPLAIDFLSSYPSVSSLLLTLGFGGQSAGLALAETLFGLSPPTGKLPISIPKH